jgi:hypothetical protein
MNATATPIGGATPNWLPERDKPFILREVYERVQDGLRTELVFVWDHGASVLRADPDTDSLEIAGHEEQYVLDAELQQISQQNPFTVYCGSKCIWTWTAVNQQGYCDSAMISFEGLIPSLLLHVIGSAIRVFTIVPAEPTN